MARVFTQCSLNLRDMLSLVQSKPTVPQIFFNDMHIGGVDELFAELERWDAECVSGSTSISSGNLLNSTVLDLYKAKVASLPDPLDRRLAPPRSTESEERSPPPRDEVNDCIRTPGPNGTKLSVRRLLRDLMDFMPRNDLKYRGVVYKNSFKGRDGVSAIQNKYELTSRDEAIFFGRLLQRRCLLQHVKSDHDFGDNDYYYRLRPYENPTVLNSFRIWTDRIDLGPVALIIRLKKLLTKVEIRHTDEHGMLDYLAVEFDPDYWTFEENVCELQKISMRGMPVGTRLAFAINTYNLMVKHGFIKVGIPCNAVQRQSFFHGVMYDIGGDLLSYSDLEHGVLRGNARPPFALNPPFSPSDPRLELAISEVDPRVHFALNCGAKSCPPVKIFTADGIEEELRIVALAFCDDESNVLIDEGSGEVVLSRIFEWYRSDFASSIAKLPDKVAQYLRGPKKITLTRMIGSRHGVKVKFHAYDWSTNASRCKDFDPSVLKEDETVVGRLFNSLTGSKGSAT